MALWIGRLCGQMRFNQQNVSLAQGKWNKAFYKPKHFTEKVDQTEGSEIKMFLAAK